MCATRSTPRTSSTRRWRRPYRKAPPAGPTPVPAPSPSCSSRPPGSADGTTSRRSPTSACPVGRGTPPGTHLLAHRPVATPAARPTWPSVVEATNRGRPHRGHRAPLFPVAPATAGPRGCRPAPGRSVARALRPRRPAPSAGAAAGHLGSGERRSPGRGRSQPHGTDLLPAHAGRHHRHTPVPRRRPPLRVRRRRGRRCSR